MAGDLISNRNCASTKSATSPPLGHTFPHPPPFAPLWLILLFLSCCFFLTASQKKDIILFSAEISDIFVEIFLPPCELSVFFPQLTFDGRFFSL